MSEPASTPPPEDRLTEVVKRNRKSQLLLGLIGIGVGTAGIAFGLVPPLDYILGGVLIAVGVLTLVRR